MFSIGRFWRETAGAFIYGSALGAFIRGNHKKSAKLLYKLHRMDPEIFFDGYNSSALLGRSLLGIGERENAYEHLNRAYDLLDLRSIDRTNQFAVREAITFLDVYKNVLLWKGETGRLDEVEEKLILCQRMKN